MSDYTSPRRESTISEGAIGGYFFAGTILFMVGIFQAFSGLAAIIDDQFFVVLRNYAFEIDVTAWGWIHLILGIVVAFAGWGLFSAQTWARVVGITLAVLSSIANFIYLPYQPFWAIIIIGLNVWVIWSLTRPVGATERY